MGKSSIQWTDDSWNPVAGCSLVSPGCTNCYAMKMAARVELMAAGRGDRRTQEKYAGLTQKVNGRAVWTGKISTDLVTLLEPLSWSKPRRVFVNSMSDLFHEGVSDEFIDRVFAVMAATPQHTYQILTKRSERMRSYMAQQAILFQSVHYVATLCGSLKFPEQLAAEVWARFKRGVLENVWLGVSVEGPPQHTRMKDLILTPAFCRFVSYEPALQEVDFRSFLGYGKTTTTSAIHWIIVGGESGRDARAFSIRWAAQTIEQCRAAGVAVFIKQLGANPVAAYRSHVGYVSCERLKLIDPAGGDMREWPADLRVREFPGGLFPGAVVAGTCRICGCTDDRACGGNPDDACSWVDASHTLCSACEPSLRRKDWRGKAAPK